MQNIAAFLEIEAQNSRHTLKNRYKITKIAEKSITFTKNAYICIDGRNQTNRENSTIKTKTLPAVIGSIKR